MISGGFKRECLIWDLRGEPFRGVRYSCFHFHREAASTLCTLILHRDPVVALVVGYLRQLSTTALNNAVFQIEPVNAVLRVMVGFIVIGHSSTPLAPSPAMMAIVAPTQTSLRLRRSRSPRRTPQIVFASTISCRSIIWIAEDKGTISTVRDCSPSSSFWPFSDRESSVAKKM
jgi:hypothetical protein